MAKTKQRKNEELEDLQDKLSKMKALVFANFDGLKVKETVIMRNILREHKLDYHVAKKTLLKLALKKAGFKDIDLDKFTGGLGLAFGYDDEIAPAKELYGFSKDHPSLKLVGGIFEGKFIDDKKVLALAKLPSKEELIIKTIWIIKSPIANFVNVLRANLRNLVFALKAISEKR